MNFTFISRALKHSGCCVTALLMFSTRSREGGEWINFRVNFHKFLTQLDKDWEEKKNYGENPFRLITVTKRIKFAFLLVAQPSSNSESAERADLIWRRCWILHGASPHWTLPVFVRIIRYDPQTGDKLSSRFLNSYSCVEFLLVIYVLIKLFFNLGFFFANKLNLKE